QDLSDRGLLDSTLVVMFGEFGRTPKINKDAGRDHWPNSIPVAIAGGGIRNGIVVGATDAHGENPTERPITPADLAATIYSLLGRAPPPPRPPPPAPPPTRAGEGGRAGDLIRDRKGGAREPLPPRGGGGWALGRLPFSVLRYSLPTERRRRIASRTT